MRVIPFRSGLLASAGVLLIAGCASHVTLPEFEADHPANPNAAAAPVTSPSQALAADESTSMVEKAGAGMPGMEHSKDMEGMKGMEGMDHGH